MSEFDSTVEAFDTFTNLLELTEQQQEETNQFIAFENDAAVDGTMLMEVEVEEGDNPSYTAPFAPPFYAPHGAGLITPFSNVNPLTQPWAGFAPVAAAPVVAVHHAAHVYPFVVGTDVKGGYNVHGLNAGNVFGGFHPGMANDLTSLGGKASAGEAAAFLEAQSTAGESSAAHSHSASHSAVRARAMAYGHAYPLASEEHDPANIEADASNVAYGLFPAPTPESSTHYVQSNFATLGPHKLQFASVGSNEIDAAFPAFVELEAEQAIDADTEAVLAELEEPSLLEVSEDGEEGGEEAAAEGGEEAAAEGGEEAAGGGGGEEAGANPSYTLPYPPVLPGHYAPLFNPYTNVNPLSTPFSGLAHQPGAHPAVAAAAAVQAGGLAAVNGQIAGAANGYPYYPYNAAVGAGVGFATPFASMGGWIHPQSLNQASVGENAEAASLGQFIELEAQEIEHGECVNCSY